MAVSQFVRRGPLSLVLVAIVLSICCWSSPALSQQSALPDAPPPKPVPTPIDHSLTFGERAHHWRRSLFSPDTIIGPALGAAIGQAENSPREWGQGWDAYAQRIGSGIGRREISETIRFGIAAADGEDPRYFRKKEGGIWPRAEHAIVSTFVSKTSTGRSIPAFSRFAGNYSAALISNAWYPPSRSTVGWAFERGTTATASAVGFNLVREFVPFWFGGAR